MLKKVFESDIASYTPHYDQSLGETYLESVEPPGFYPALLGLYRSASPVAGSEYTIALVAQVQATTEFRRCVKRWFFNAVSGALVQTEYFYYLTDHSLNYFRQGGPTPHFDSPDSLSQSATGALYGTAGNFTYSWSASRLERLGSGTAFNAWEAAGDRIFLHMSERDLRVHKTGNSEIGVHDLTTKALLRRIGLPGTVLALGEAVGDFLFALCAGGILALVNHTTGEIVSVMQDDGLIAPVAYSSAQIHYDAPRSRLLACVYTPNDASGASTLRCLGFKPTPIATGLTAPIPTRRPLQGRSVVFVSQAYGDAGEPVSGLRTALTLTGDVTTSRGAVVTDASGIARANVKMDGPGAANVAMEIQTDGNS